MSSWLVGKTQIAGNGGKSETMIGQILKYIDSIDNCPLAGCILNIEEASVASRISIACTIVFLCLVVLDKRLTFSKVIGMEHMLRMKNFSSSDIHFNMTIFIPIVVVGLGVAIFNTFFTGSGQETKIVSNMQLLRYC